MKEIFIVGFDGSEQSQRAVDYAAERARVCGASLHLVQVLEWSAYSFHTPEELNERHKRREQELKRANAMLEPVASAQTAKGLETTTEVRHGHAADLLCQIAVDKSAEKIFIGRTGHSSFEQRLLGGLAITLAQVSPVPLVIVP